VLASSAATSRANELDVVISGFDNTYFDRRHVFRVCGPQRRGDRDHPADFSTDFQTFFKDRREVRS